MGLGGISIWQLLIILAIVVVLFGTKRLRTLGQDLGSAVKGFRNALNSTDDQAIEKKTEDNTEQAEAHEKPTSGSNN